MWSHSKATTYESLLCFDALQALVWDDKLTGPFGLIAEYKLLKVPFAKYSSFCKTPVISLILESTVKQYLKNKCLFSLKEHEVEVMFPLGPGRLPPSQVHNVIFITRPKPSLMDIIADNVLRYICILQNLCPKEK